MFDRRHLLKTLVAASPAFAIGPALAEMRRPNLIVTKDPDCGCCEGWVEHMRAAGFRVEVVAVTEIGEVKARLGVPQDLAACHTAEIDGYVIEGHVPAEAVKRLLNEKPNAKGLAVPGMPLGSPGMEVRGVDPSIYEVVLFGPAGRAAFAKYKGLRQV